MPSKKYVWFMFLLSTIFFFYEFILRVSPGIIADQLRLTFQINAEQLGFMGSIFFFAYASMQIPVGIIFDHFSTRKTLSYACLMCSIGTILFASTHNFNLAIIGRCIIGIGAAFGFVGSLKIAEQWLPLKHFSFISGFLFTLGFFGASISDNLLSVILVSQSWTTLFLYLGVFGIILSFIIYFSIYDSPVISEKRDQLSLVDMISGFKNVIRNPYIWINSLIGFFLYSPTSAFTDLWGKSYLQTVLHLQSNQAVFAITAVFIGWGLGGPLIGWFSDRLRNRKLFLCLGSLSAAILISLVLYVPIFNYISLYILLTLFGISSAAQILNFVYAMEICDRKFSATAMATTNMIVVLGAAFLQPFIGKLLDLNWSQEISNTGMPIYLASDYQKAFIILPIALLLSGILSLFLKKTEHVEY